MGNITENPVWEETVFQVETTTPLLGGSPEKSSFGTPTAGYLNVAQQQLANRTQYLKDALDNTDIDVGGLSDRVDTVETSLTAHIGSRGLAHTNATQTEAGFMSAADKTKLNGVETGAQVNVATNLSQGTRTANTVPVTSSTGTAATLEVATTSLAGIMSSADKAKLDGLGAAPVTSVAGKTGDISLTKTDVGLANVDNTSDLNKPVSTAQQTALNLKANLSSPPLTGIPTAPTATVGTNTTQIATTAFVTASMGSAGGGMIYLQDQKPVGTSGGALTTTLPTRRDLNTVVFNNISGASLNAASLVTLPPGRYYFEGYSSYYNISQLRTWVILSDADRRFFGSSDYYSGTVIGKAIVGGVFDITVSSTAQLIVQSTVNTNPSTTGLGLPASVAGVAEVYSELKFWKI